MTLGIRYVENVCSVGESFGSGGPGELRRAATGSAELGLQSRAAIAAVALLPRARHAMQGLRLRINPVDGVAFAEGQIEVAIRRQRERPRTVQRRSAHRRPL